MSERLESPEQLPDLKGRKLVFGWDQEDADSIVTCNGTVIWRERTGWEVYHRFGEIAAILQRKYGARIKDLVPAPGSEFALYGDSFGANPYVQMIRERLASGKPKKYSYWELENAVKLGDVGALSLYLLGGGYPSATHPSEGTTLLHLAARWHLAGVVRLLVKAGAKVNALDRSGTSPLCEALSERPLDQPDVAAERKVQALEIVKLLVEGGANPDGVDRPVSKLTRTAKDLYNPALEMAARQGNLDVVRYLLERGANVDHADADGSTALHSAVNHGHLDVVRALIAGGADVNRPDPLADAMTPLMRAIRPLEGKEHAAEMVRTLVQAGAKLNTRDARGEMPLLMAISNGNLEVVSLLLALGADVHRSDSDGDSPLAYAVQAAGPHRFPPERMAPILQALRAAGADPSVRNKKGKSAHDLARELGLATLEALLA
jgi:ankyrin repeat protein